jgi:hypothetical protein
MKQGAMPFLSKKNPVETEELERLTQLSRSKTVVAMYGTDSISFEQANNLQWILALVPLIKALQMALSFLFW